MSKLPNLPLADLPKDGFQERMRFNVERELATLKTKQRITFEDRLAAYYSTTAAPTGGRWVQGDRVRNSAPAEAGAVASKYVITGWICTVTGTPGTWLEMRTLTGN